MELHSATLSFRVNMRSGTIAVTYTILDNFHCTCVTTLTSNDHVLCGMSTAGKAVAIDDTS